MKLSIKINKLNSNIYIIFNEIVSKKLIKNFNSLILIIPNSLNNKSSSPNKKNLITFYKTFEA